MHVLIVMLIQTENLEGVMAFQFAIYFNSHRNYRVNVLQFGNIFKLSDAPTCENLVAINQVDLETITFRTTSIPAQAG